MYLEFELIYFLWILSYVEVTEFKFNFIPLGNSGILVFWEPRPEHNSTSFFIFYYKKIQDTEKYTTFNLEDEDFQNMPDEVSSVVGQFKIPSLEENTTYFVAIEHLVSDQTKKEWHNITVKTNVKSNTAPERPDFRYFYTHIQPYTTQMRWFPCGKKRSCNKKEAGSSFSIKYGSYDTKSTYCTNNIDKKDYEDVFFFFGRIYDVKIISLNGNSTTESDSQEIFLKPMSSAPKSVKIISMTSTSVLISWKSPSQLSEKLENYVVRHTNFSNVNNNGSQCSPHFDTIMDLVQKNIQQIRISNLQPAVEYSFYIIPCGNTTCGYEFHINHMLNPQNSSLPLAKPGFRLQLLDDCNLIIEWWPCGELFNCKDTNTKPGSFFQSACKMEHDVNWTYTAPTREEVYVIVKLQPNEMYVVTVRSIDESGKYEQADEKKIETSSCTMP